MRILLSSHYRRSIAVTTLLAAAIASVSACSRGQTQAALPAAAVSHRVELESGGVSVLNYTPWYIHEFEVEGPEGSGIQGGGPNVMPAGDDGQPSGGGKETCCMTYPAEWQPDLRLTVRWLVNKKMDGKTPSYWYKAENVRIAKYNGKQTGGVWGIYLPDDRFRLMIVDGNHDGGNNPNNRPPDDDPLIVKGVLDDEWNELYPNGVARGIQ